MRVAKAERQAIALPSHKECGLSFHLTAAPNRMYIIESPRTKTVRGIFEYQ